MAYKKQKTSFWNGLLWWVGITSVAALLFSHWGVVAIVIGSILGLALLWVLFVVALGLRAKHKLRNKPESPPTSDS